MCVDPVFTTPEAQGEARLVAQHQGVAGEMRKLTSNRV